MTPNDTPNSPTSDPSADPAAVAPPADPVDPAAPPAADPSPDGTVLGGAADPADPADPPADPAAEGPPEAYDLKLTDDKGEPIELDKEAVEAADPVFRELGLTNDQANKLMPVAKSFAERTQQTTLAAIVEAGAQQKKTWLDQFKADPEIGGAKQQETEHLAGKALDALGFTLTGFGDDKKQPHPFRKALTDTGFGNHPDMIRAFRKVGEMVGEDGFVSASNTPPAKLDRLGALYPDDVPK